MTPRALLDTHALVWFLHDDRRLSAAARRLIEDPAVRLLVSAASIIEIVIKVQIGKLQFHEPPRQLIPRSLRDIGATVLPVRGRHAIRILRLPLHHRDPFDRVILAQARAEGLPIISNDGIFRRYPVKIIW